MGRQYYTPLISLAVWPGLIIAGVLTLLAAKTLHTFWDYLPATIFHSNRQNWQLYQQLLWTIQQALSATCLTLLLAVPLARTLARRQFWARKWVMKLCTIAPLLPTLSLLFGLVALYGRCGWLAQFCSLVGLNYPYSIYSFSGIMLAHLFFNLPLAARLLLKTLSTIPEEQYQLADQLGMTPLDCFRWIEWPHLCKACYSTALLIFILCFSSFTIPLTLGGGSATTTLQVAIYQAIERHFDLKQAAQLAILHFGSCIIGIVATQILATPGAEKESTYALQERKRYPQRLDSVDLLMLLLLLLLVILPLFAVAIEGCTVALRMVLMCKAFWLAVGTSLIIALLTGLLAVLCALLLLWSSSRLRPYQWTGCCFWLEASGSLIFAFPPCILATALFLHLRTAPSLGLSWILLILSNTLLALPYTLRALATPLYRLQITYERLCCSLNLQGFYRWQLIDWPLLKQPLLFALALAITSAFGDCGATTLFSHHRLCTLPRYLYQQIESYHYTTSAAIALLMLLICIGVFALLERLDKKWSY